MLLIRNRYIRNFIFLSILVLPVRNLLAQTLVSEKTKSKKVYSGGVATSGSAQIDVNLSTRTFSTLPFDEEFFIKLSPGKDSYLGTDQLISATCYYKKNSSTRYLESEFSTYKTEAEGNNVMAADKWRSSTGSRSIVTDPLNFPIMKLPPNRDFTFIFEFVRKPSDKERESLVKFTDNLLRATIEAKAKNADFEFKSGEVTAIVAELESKITEYFKASKLTITIAPAVANSKFLSNSVKSLSSPYEATRLSKTSIDKSVAFFRSRVKDLSIFIPKYEKTAKDKNKSKNLSLLGILDNLGTVLIDYPSGERSLDTGINKNYQKQISSYLTALNQVSIPGDQRFLSIKEGLTSGLEMMAFQHKDYAESVIGGKKITDGKVAKWIEEIEQEIYERILVSGTTFNPNFKTRANSYISADLGVALIPAFGKTIPYLGTNIYFRPVNKNEKFTWDTDFTKRVSLLIGLTAASIKKDNYRDDLLGSNFNLITGAGIRVASFIRTSTGAIWYTKVNPNPLNSNNSISAKLFISLSFDIDVKTVFNSLFTPAAITAHSTL